MASGERNPILRKDTSDTEWNEVKTFLIVFMSVMNVFMFLGNILSLVTICYNDKLRRQVSYWFVMNLAMIDLLISVTVVPLNIVWEYYGTWPFNHIACEFFTFADIAFSTICAYSIVLVSIDKYIYITYSIQYYDKMTRKLAVIMIITVWIFVFIFTTISILTEVGTSKDFKNHFLETSNISSTCIFVMTDAYVVPSAVISFFLPFGILCFTSTKIVCIASKHIRKIHSISNSLTSDTDSETIKMSRAKVRANTLTSVTNECSKTRVNKNIPEIKIDPPSNGKTDAEDNMVHGSGKTEEEAPEEKISNMTADTSRTVFMTNGSARTHFTKDDENISTLHTSADSVEASLKPTHSKSAASSSIKTTDSLRSVTLKKSESIRSVSVRKKTSPYCKLFGTVTIVIACFILMFAPYNVAIVVDVRCHCVEAWIYEDILAVLYYMHSLVNPYIYMATDRKYKAGLKKLWRKLSSIASCCNRNKL